MLIFYGPILMVLLILDNNEQILVVELVFDPPS